jgi:parallel beta-helix repeat protein
MRRRLLIGMALAVLACSALPSRAAGATTYHVNDDDATDDTTGCGDNANPCNTISAALDIPTLSPGDTIEVAAGTYNERATVDVGVILRGAQAGVDARSRDSVADSAKSVIAGVDVGLDVTAQATIDGFDIRGSSASATTPPGIDLENGPGVDGGHRIRNNVLEDLRSGVRVFTDAAGPQTELSHNVMRDNVLHGVEGDSVTVNDLVIDENDFNGNLDLAVNLQPVSGSGVALTGNRSTGDKGLLTLQNVPGILVDRNAVTDSTGSAVTLLAGTSDARITGNAISGAAADGIAIQGTSNSPTITGNTVTGNGRGIFAGNATYSGPFEVHFNRIAGNAGGGLVSEDGDPIDAEDNWWGCNAGPAQPGCDAVPPPAVGQAPDHHPWLQLRLQAAPGSIPAGGSVSVLTADLTRNSEGEELGSIAFPATPVAFATTLGSAATPRSTFGGAATSTLTSGSGGGTAQVTATLDNQSANASVTIEPPPPPPPPPPDPPPQPPPAEDVPEDRPPAVAFTSPAPGTSIPTDRVTPVTVDASDDQGVALVTFYDRSQPICVDAVAPFACPYVPNAEVIGRNTLVAVATDTAGQTAADFLNVRVERFTPQTVAARTTPGRDRRAPFRFRTRGKVELPAGVTVEQACGTGIVQVDVERRGRRISRELVEVGPNCGYTARFKLSAARRGRLRVSARFLGNDVLAPGTAKSQRVRAG